MLIITLALLGTFLITLSTSKSLQGYNEPCELYDETSSCDDAMGLMCIDSGLKGYRCRCPTDNNQFGTVFDSRMGRCVGKVFNNCVRGAHSPSSGNNGGGNNESFCVENAECNHSVYYLPICLCKKGFFETDDGSCAPVAKYGESCTNDTAQCDARYGLDCQDGKCSCKDPSNQFYDLKEEKCSTNVGGNCSLEESLCVPNAECVKSIKFPLVSPKRSIIFGESEEQVASAAGEISFSTSRDSPPGPPSSHLYHANPSPNGGVQGSNFNMNIYTGSGKCVCKSGYSPSARGHCMKSYRSVCKMMDTGAMEICNPDQFLDCLDSFDGNFRCQCRSPMNERWDDELKKCVSMISKKCRPFPYYPPCDTGSECMGTICKCKLGTSLTPTGNCKVDYNESCTPGQCNSWVGLTCHGKTATCLCLDSYLNYDEKKKACLAPVGAPCGIVDLMGFQKGSRIFQSDPVSLGYSSPSEVDPRGKEGMPFIGCQAGLICIPSIEGRRMAYSCVKR